MMMPMGEMWGKLGSTFATIMLFYAMFKQYFPYDVQSHVEKYTHRILGLVNPYIQITFNEFVGERLQRSEAFAAIQAYLAANSSKQVRRLKADVAKDSKNILLSMDDHEEVPDEYRGVKVWWTASKNAPKTQSLSIYPSSDEKRYYTLSFHRRDRELIVESYLNHVLDSGKAIMVQNRQRKLYTNGTGDNWFGRKSKWSHVVFDHPASFRTLAMDLEKKNELIDDLTTFSKSKDYYAMIGKAWKRGYLLYGPPGTGKSTFIAAMANLLNYDVYDLELTAVKDNTELRKLLIEITNKSIIVIEDIDCSLDLTRQRKKKEDKKDDDGEKDPLSKKLEEEKNNDSKVTLSGLLNVIDGLWSACGGERIIVFTTNHVDKLDPALIRRGRMDKHIELSYCTFQGFKVLAKNYLGVDSHELFDEIEKLLKETQMTPADVAENLMFKTFTKNKETYLESLIQSLKDTKEAARLKGEEEEKEHESAKKVETKEKESIHDKTKDADLAASKD